jgi:hypothetical protein
MKKVFTSSIEVCHVFAQRTQDEATTSTRNLFFDDKNKIYSYGRHYLLAEFINDETILINNTGYSNTTSKHISQITQATRQYKQHFFKDICLQNVYNRIKEASQKLINARKKEVYALEIINAFESFTSFLNEFKQYVNYSSSYYSYGSYNLTSENELKNSDKFKEIQSIYLQIFENKESFIEAGKERIKREKEKAKEKLKKDLEKFFNYEIDYINTRDLKEDFLRISEDKRNIETTQQIKIDINEAQTLYRLIKEGKDIKGYRIGYYTVISLNGVLKVGCHNINRNNLTEIGEQIINL